jgi:hypothetical protein
LSRRREALFSKIAGLDGRSIDVSYSSLIETLFSGPSVTSTSPPHNGLAVGPNNIVMVEGSRIEWTNLAGGSPTLQSTYNFFSSLSPTGGLYDQRCVYDSVNQRYIVIMQYAASGATISDIDIAVSKDSNPNDGWYFASLNTSLTINGQLTGSDRPMLSADGANIYITAAQFNVNISGYVGTESWVIGDTAGPGGGIYNGGTLTVTANQLTPSNTGVFTVAASNNGKTYYASDYANGGQILLALQTYDKATSTFGPVSTISLGNIDQGGAYTVQQNGTSLLLDAVDNRIGNIVYANGFLYGVAEMKPIGSGVPLVHWFKVDVSNLNAPTLVAQGDISGAAIGANVATFNSSIAVDGAGDVIINFTASGPNNYPSDYYVFQGAGDPPGSFSAPILYQASTGFFDSGDGASVQRWGLNSSTTVDPNNPNSFWLSNEYVANGWWQTSVAQIAIQNIAATAPTVTSIAASGTGITNGTGDLNASKVVTLTVNFSAAVTVNTTGGTPTLTLNDSGTATYTGGSGTTALTFSYAVQAGQNTSDLIVSSLSPNGARMKDAAGNDANLTGAANYNPAGTLQIDTIAPVPVFTQEPPLITSSNTALFAFGTSNNETNGAAYAYKLDGATTWSPATGNTVSLSGLANGSHTIQIQATDGAGNVSAAASYSWTITQAASAPPDHIVVVFEENHNYSQIVGNSAAPFINSLATQGTLFTNFYAITHPSQPNYFAAFSGSTQGVADDATHFFPTTTTLGGELQQAGKSFIGYGETGTGQEHSPWLSFGDSQGMGQNFSQFPTDFSQLPTVSFVSPSNLDNMHDGTIAQGDQWLNTNLNAYANWAKTNNSLLIVTFDEDDGTAANHIPTIVYGAGAGAGLSYQYENLYGLLHTIENMYGLPALGVSASTPAMSFAPATAATGSSQVATSFSGISVTSTYPPNNGLAVGPNNVVMMEGSRIEWTNLTGGSPTLQSVYTFFAPLGSTAASSLNHPRCVYDGVNQRYIAVMDNSASGHTISNIDIAVSKDSNPNDGWYFASLNTSLTINGQLTSADSPTVSADGTNIYITTSQYNVNVSGYAGTECWVIGDTAGAGGGLYNGGALTVVANQITPSTQGIFTAVAGNNGKTYYASDYSSGSQVVVTLQTYDSASNTFGPSSTINLGNIDQGGTYTAQQLGTSLLLDASDKRTRNLAYANGFLYGVTEIKPIGSSVPLVHWFKIDVSNPNAPTLVAQGDITGAAIGTSVATFNPSIAVDAAGDVIINFTASGPNMYPGDYYVYQRGSDPPGSFSAPALYQASTGFFNSGNGASVQPWGNYSSATVDPSNPNSFWISNQYVANGWWQTSVAKVTIQNPVATTPTVSSIATSGTGVANGSGDLNAGHLITMTVNFSAAVTVNTTSGAPTLTLNDGGTATYTGGSGTTALTFSYTVAAGQNTPDLVVSSFNLNGATVKDGAGNVADLSGATNNNPAGTLQIDTIASTVSSIATSGPGITNGSGNLGTGQVVTLTVNMSEAVTIAGGTPTLTLNDGGTATYTGGSGTTALTFSYTVAAGQNTPDLVVSSFSLNGATVKDGAGNVADLSAATNYNPTGTLQISTTALAISSIATSGTGIANGSGDLNAGRVATLTVNFSAAVTVNTTGGAPTLTLNDGGTATYTGGSGTTALTFSYTVAAGQNTPDLVVSSFNLNGATVKDGAGNVADLSGATNSNPAGTLQIDTIAPVPVFSQEPPLVSSSSTAVFAFTTSNAETNGVGYAYKLDGATTWTAVTGSALSLSGLANGSHAIQVQATDGAGNVSGSPASYNWTIAPAVAQIETQFSGISVTSTYPPNNGLAVGPNNVVMMEGSRIEWTNLTGGSPTLQSVYTFFAPLGSTAASSLNHPRCVYDSVNQRYIVVMDNSASGHTISNIDIAVSKDSNPNDGWYFASLNTSLTINGQLTSADSPTVSFDGTNIYITTSQYNVNVSGYAGTECWVIGDTAGAGGGLYNGGALTVVANQITPSTQSIFKVVAGNNGKTYYASDYSPGGSQVVVTLQTYDATTNTFGPSSTISLGNIDQGGTYTAQQLGTSLLLDASDKRTRNLAYANGFLYGVTEIKPIGSSVPLVHWFKIDVSNPNAPTLVAQGDITGAAIGTSVATFNPSIAVDAAGDVIINFTASGPNMYPGDYYVYQRSSDPPGSFSAPALYQASTGFFNSGNGASVQPWGNYSSATVDPNNPNSFWISNQYVANGWWQTSVAKVAIETAETPTLTITNTSLNVTAGGSVPLGITATPVDSDDTISVKIAGVPTYETVTAPSGVTVTSGLQADGTNTWTITESASTTGAPLTALTLSSSYTGSDHPVATFTVTASNTTPGETATSAAQTMTVTDPPAMTPNGGPSASPTGGAVASTPGSGQIDRLAALMDQFTAAGFHEVRTGAGAITSMFGSNASHEDLAFLATPRFHHA